MQKNLACIDFELKTVQLKNGEVMTARKKFQDNYPSLIYRGEKEVEACELLPPAFLPPEVL